MALYTWVAFAIAVPVVTARHNIIWINRWIYFYDNMWPCAILEDSAYLTG